MNILGIESSCDECSAAVVQDGKNILSHIIATQIEYHKPFEGVVPEIASRKHTEWILDVFKRAMAESVLSLNDIDGIAVTNRPGLLGSLIVGLAFSKALSMASGIPFLGIDHIKAHLYAPHLIENIPYPHLGVLISGGHTIIGIVKGFDDFQVLGTTVDDACGEAFDKVAKYYGLGYPGGVVIDRLSKQGDASAFSFPDPSLHKGHHDYDLSYSGLKTAVINQLDQFRNEGKESNHENIAASFQKAAIDMILKRLIRAVKDTGITTVLFGGGVAANSYLREAVKNPDSLGVRELNTIFPPMKFCTDNAAMIAGIGYHYFKRGDSDSLDLKAYSRVTGLRHAYP
ncbi:MAG: tRNA (adenosine(37)-N6)-threonylcarbamoyltransferase complex transferase subunit TsaD [Spirochaetia bacterium]